MMAPVGTSFQGGGVGDGNGVPKKPEKTKWTQGVEGDSTEASVPCCVPPQPPAPWEGKEWCEADGHCGLRRERPREGEREG